MADLPDAIHLTTLESEDLQALGRPNPGDVAGRFPLLLTTSFSLESCCHCFTPAGMELHCSLSSPCHCLLFPRRAWQETRPLSHLRVF